MALSRRTFMYGSAAGVGVAWGGLTIFAGAAAVAEPRSQNSTGAGQPGAFGRSGKAGEFGDFIYGTQFYRPPNPPRSERKQMLAQIRGHYGFNLVRLYPTWNYYNRAPGQFDFSEIEEVMKDCDELGLKVLMGIVLETAPYWLEQAHPESRFVNAKGAQQPLKGSSAQPSGGWPGLCLDWEPVRQAANTFITKLVEAMAPHPSLYAYDCWNEPHLEPAWTYNIWATPQEKIFCYCPQTIAGFHEWLKARYGTIDRVNEAWIRAFPNWEAIDAPRDMGTYIDWLDWRRYTIDSSTKYMHLRADGVRKIDSRHVIESHCAHHPPLDGAAREGTNGWSLASVVDVWGMSVFPRWFGLPIHQGAAKIDLVRSNAAGKPFWITELQGGASGMGLQRGSDMRPRDIRSWNWLAVAGGASGIVYWAYLAEATSIESTGYGLVQRDGSTTPRAEEAAKNHRLIQAHWDHIKAARPKPEVALLFDYDNALLTFAMSGDETASTDSFNGYHEALWRCDLWADFIQPDSIRPGAYKVLIVPWHLIGKRETSARVQAFAEAGGTVILEAAFGRYDEQTVYNPVVPPYGLAEAFGYREGESFSMKPRAKESKMNFAINTGLAESHPEIPPGTPQAERIYYDPPIEFTQPIAVKLAAQTFLTPIKVSSATVIAKSFGYDVAAHKQVGKGQIFYVGTSLGASIKAGDSGGVDLLRAMISPVVKPAVKGDKLRPRIMEGDGRALLVVFNDTASDRTETLSIPAKYRSATDIHQPRKIAITKGSLEVTVPYQDVVVLLLT